MSDNLITKLADVPLARPGFDALGMSAPVLVQMNPDGKWENSAPANLDEERLKAIVQHLVKSKVVDAAQSYCCQCAAENKTFPQGGAGAAASVSDPNYVPVIMMPIYPSTQCPFDMECEAQKLREPATKPDRKSTKMAQVKDSEMKTQKKPKKRGFVLQRLTDFDLLSQW